MSKKDLDKEKLNVLILGDHPLHLSGVAHALRDITNSLLNTNRFRIIHLGAAIKHDDMRPIKPREDWIVVPCEGFGTIQQVSQICHQNQIDIILMMSDPRFYTWLLHRDNEIRNNIPIVWYCIWDNLPYPIFNSWIWNSVDYNVAISQVTHELLNVVCPNNKNISRLPHCVNDQIFKPLSEDETNSFINKHLAFAKDKFIVFWNNRNGRRKNGANLITGFRRFLDRVGHDKAVLIMKTDAIDPVGFNLPEVISGYELEGKVVIIQDKLSEEILNKFYNAADVTVNLSNAEGFGMGSLESLNAGTPIICTYTGGMTEQLTDNRHQPTEYYGIPLFPGSKAVIGSVELPFIFEEQINEDDYVDALEMMYNLGHDKRKEWGLLGMKHVHNNMNWENFNNFWPNLFINIHNTNESWPNKEYTSIRFEEFNKDSTRFEATKKPWELPPAFYLTRNDFEKWTKSSNIFKEYYNKK